MADPITGKLAAVIERLSALVKAVPPETYKSWLLALWTF